ncbi:WXG100 family type VII secretion target [Solwaraspora sp. WMMD791]|uniref:WXG100 family type VII secretion target n=1 Tax=Solwaraspora sp. WMMD791 TaxID=3016086 RepID=UPI00249CC793|nr:WXG100 family type VII secretion target [Solwaraspora sp. WMMD791]WFE27090.1 WXG100 family type VII secretion target [Solwaraspora sp. WMMD791]
MPEMTFAEFRVALGELQAAIGTVAAEKTRIDTALAAIGAQFAVIDAAWDGPASDSFMELKTWYDGVSTELSSVLGDMIDRMRTAESNYRAAETENQNNAS